MTVEFCSLNCKLIKVITYIYSPVGPDCIHNHKAGVGADLRLLAPYPKAFSVVNRTDRAPALVELIILGEEINNKQ